MNLGTVGFCDGVWSTDDLPGRDSDQTLILAFGAPEYRDALEPLRRLLVRYPRAHVIGCSTAGEILGTSLADRSLSVAVASFDDSTIRSARASVGSAGDSRLAGQQIARQLSSPELRAVFVLSPGHSVNGSDLVRGLNENLPESVVVTGGLAGDGDRFERTWVFDRDGMHQQEICAVGLYGDGIRVGHGSKGGWDRFGPERRVTHSEGNVLYALDGKPALQLYKEYLGDYASSLPAGALLFPLALRTRTDADKQLVRTVLAVDEVAQSMTFAGDVPQDSMAQLMRANFDRLIDGASEAALMSRRAEAEGDVLSVAISCVGRRLVLKDRVEEELEATLDVLPERAQQVGFYSYGEISPYASGACDLHNQTMTLTTIHEQPRTS